MRLNFFEFCRFTGSFFQVIEFCASDFAVANDLDAVDLGRMKRERSFNADAACDTTNYDCFADAAVLSCNDDSLVSLDTFSRTFNDFDVHFDGVADCDFG